jgi:RIO kinase 1
MTFSWSDNDLAFTPAPELDHDQRWSTWSSVQKLCQGPHPRPGWVVTADAAIDTELGVLKTGKEADVHLVERAVPGDPARSVLLAAKRYRTAEHRQFRRDDAYTEGRRVRNTRDARAMARKTAFGRAVASGQWAAAEWDALCRAWRLGVPVPYPVQIDGTEILLEYIDVDGCAAPRLAQTRPDRGTLAAYFDQIRDAMLVLARAQIVHGDLSAYNILAQGDRLVVIDLPQVIDLISNPRGLEYLQRDCTNVCTWFVQRGFDVDAEVFFGDLVAEAI